MHQTLRLMVTNYNSWTWSYWKENLSYGNRPQIPDYLGSTSNLLSLDLKNCGFIAIFLKFIDFICSFVQRHNAFGLHTWTERITNICVICQQKGINRTWSLLRCRKQQEANSLASKYLREEKVESVHRSNNKDKEKQSLHIICFVKDKIISKFSVFLSILTLVSLYMNSHFHVIVCPGKTHF